MKKLAIGKPIRVKLIHVIRQEDVHQLLVQMKSQLHEGKRELRRTRRLVDYGSLTEMPSYWNGHTESTALAIKRIEQYLVIPFKRGGK